MKVYNVCITETLEKVVQIEADDPKKAVNKVWDLYLEDKIILTADDLTSSNVSVLPD